jgi:hypothetical protein
MRIDEMHAAVNEAKTTLEHTDNVAGKLASLLVGRMRKVDNEWVLGQLKRELQNFDARAKKWRK